MDVVSFFSGAGGLDLGFKQAGFNIIWGNEYDREIWATYEANHPESKLDRRSIVDIPADEVPSCDGIIGGPPCQSWSAAGAARGIEDKRGKLFYDFIRILEDKQPKFFLAENVSGMLIAKHSPALDGIKELLTNAGAGYELSFCMLNAKDYNVPQDRKRVFFIGIRKDLDFKYQFPTETFERISLRDSIYDLKDSVMPATSMNKTNGDACSVLNHEYMTGGFSTMYMSRNRVRTWDEQSFTIQAGGRHAPIHPSAPKMELVEKDVRRFIPGSEHLYRRLSVRECARIQTFPDDFKFIYHGIAAGYKMIGNAVPVNLAKFLAQSIKEQIENNSHVKVAKKVKKAKKGKTIKTVNV